MIDQTYNTYLNASTYISNTAFESASLSEQQLLAFADYTMAGLYHPLIMTDERAMMREAKQMTPENVTELAALLDVMAEQGAKVSVNSQKLVAENSELFAVTDDCFMFSGSMPEGDEAEEASGEVDEAA